MHWKPVLYRITNNSSGCIRAWALRRFTLSRGSNRPETRSMMETLRLNFFIHLLVHSFLHSFCKDVTVLYNALNPTTCRMHCCWAPDSRCSMSLTSLITDSLEPFQTSWPREDYQLGCRAEFISRSVFIVNPIWPVTICLCVFLQQKD